MHLILIAPQLRRNQTHFNQFVSHVRKHTLGYSVRICREGLLVCASPGPPDPRRIYLNMPIEICVCRAIELQQGAPQPADGPRVFDMKYANSETLSARL